MHNRATSSQFDLHGFHAISKFIIPLLINILFTRFYNIDYLSILWKINSFILYSIIIYYCKCYLYLLRFSQEVDAMTLEELKASQQPYLTPADIAPILHCDPQCIRKQATQDPAKLGFPVIIMGHRVRIPRIPFLKFLGHP